MTRFIKIIRYIPSYLRRFVENILFYLQNEKTYKDISYRSTDDNLYPIDFTFWVNDGHYDVQNSDGIPIKHHIDGDVYSWSRICNYALYNFNEYKITNDKRFLEKFINIAAFVESNLKINKDQNICVLYHEFDWLELKNPWIGALVQGLIASIMMRYYLISDNNKYLELAEAASNLFFISVKNGGVVKKINNSSDWLEEYPINDKSKYSFVLNGFMIALIGLYDTAKISKNKKYSERYYELLYSLNENLDLFLVENNKWSVYSNPLQGKNYVTPSYQSLHLVLLSFHSKKANLPFLNEVVKTWDANFLSKRLRAKCFIKKLKYWINNPNTV